MKNIRVWGKPPYKVAVVHGGPGMPGAVAPIARELSSDWGVLEPLQTKDTLEGQVQELRDILEKKARLPVILVGHSWGAMLAYILAARYPSLVKKLILIGSGPFEEKYADNITPDRLKRLSETERIDAIELIEKISDPDTQDKDGLMARLAGLYAKADTYDPLPYENWTLEFNEAINRRVWAEAKRLRVSGELLELGGEIQCPVVAIHGDYDPHLVKGVREPLSRVIKNFAFTLLLKCGHFPWMERYARDKFFEVLKEEIA